MKTQTIRILDVIFIGPLMIYAGLKTKENWLHNSMMMLGLATILYNGNNWLQENRK